MRRFLPLLLVVALLLPAQSAAADSLVVNCQTSNGPKLITDVANELAAAGYGGPWDKTAMAAAYARTTGASVQCDGLPAAVFTASPSTSTPPGQAAGHGRTIVLEVGGYDSSLDSGNWVNLEQKLGQMGYQPNDFFHYSYRQWNVAAGSLTMEVDGYELIDTCAPIQNEADQVLGPMLRFIRDNHWADHAVIVSHSLGGLVATQAVIDDPTLAGDFVRGLVTVDSPFGGINGWFSALGNLGGGCPSVGEMGQHRAQEHAWQAYYAAALSPLRSRGLRILAVANPNDDFISPLAECLCLLNGANTSLVGDGHSGVFFNPASVNTIAQWIGPQG